MDLIAWLEVSLPLTNPVLKFFTILVVILFAPLVLNRVKIPHLLGLIIAGAIIGPNGINLIERDSGIILSGTAGLLYIMFLAGLEIDLQEFRKNRFKSVVFGLYTFVIPMLLGVLSSLFILKFSVMSSILLASMFASHTLIAYPIISKFGVNKNPAVTMTVGGTVITDTLALLVLAVIARMSTGSIDAEFWLRLLLSLLVFGGVLRYVFPRVGHWFLRRHDDSVTQFIFVLTMVFLGAILAEWAGIEPIIGAFMAGLALNRLIPYTSPLMNRVEFVGNAIFIPFFLIGVGMLVDIRVFYKDLETVKVAIIMTLVATVSKYIAAWLTQKTYRLNQDERSVIFGLSNSQAAATLAAVLVGYNITTGETADGTPIRLLNESVLNGTILMILITCTIATLAAQKGARNLMLSEGGAFSAGSDVFTERVLIPIKDAGNTEELITMATWVKSRKNYEALYALCVVDANLKGIQEDQAKKILQKAAVHASATDNLLHELLRYDTSVLNGIVHVIRENKITDLIIGMSKEQEEVGKFSDSIGRRILAKCNVTTFIYKPVQPLRTIKRHIILVPQHAEKEVGFPFWLLKIWNIARNTGVPLVFYGTKEVLSIIRAVQAKNPISGSLYEFVDWEDFLVVSRDLRQDDNLIIVMSRPGKPSYHERMQAIPSYQEKYFKSTSFILLYPMQSGNFGNDPMNLQNPSMEKAVYRIEELESTLSRIFK